MHKKALLACLLVVAMLLSGCALIEKDEAVDRATEIIRVGDTVYTKGEVLDQVEYQLSYFSYLYQLYGMSFDPTDPEAIATVKEDVIAYLVEDAVQNAKVKELGLDQLTDEEQAELQTAIDEAWQSNLDSVQSAYFADTELTGDELTAALEAKCEELGILKESVANAQTITYTQEKLREYVIQDVVVTEEELQAALDEKAETAKSNYESNPNSYGTNVNNGLTVYYRPAGYRMVKQILIKFHEDDQTLIDDISAQVTEQESTITTLTTQLAVLGVSDVDALVEQVNVNVTPATADVATTTDVVAAFSEDVDAEVAELAQQLAEALALKAAYTEQLDQATLDAFANIDEEADDVLAQLAEGADWDTLMAEKTQDPGMQGDRATAQTGYAVCEGFSSFDSAFVDAAMALENVGDVSPKTKGSYGYYIIQYTSEVEEGPVDLDDVRETLSASTLSTKQDTVFNENLEAWVNEADAQIDRNALDR